MSNYPLFDDTLKDQTRTFGAASFAGNATFGAASFAGNVTVSAADALTATASGTQATALVLTATVNRLSTVATTADSVALPVSKAGMVVYLTNSGANSAQVFGQTPDTINAVATATGVALAATKTALFVCPVAGKWFMILTA